MYDHVQSYRPLYGSEFKRITLAAFERMDYMRARTKTGKNSLGDYCNNQGKV